MGSKIIGGYTRLLCSSPGALARSGFAWPSAQETPKCGCWAPELILGGVATLVTSTSYSAILYNTSTRHPLTLATAAGLILFIGFRACILLARRAWRTTPARVLREE